MSENVSCETWRKTAGMSGKFFQEIGRPALFRLPAEKIMKGKKENPRRVFIGQKKEKSRCRTEAKETGPCTAVSFEKNEEMFHVKQERKTLILSGKMKSSIFGRRISEWGKKRKKFEKNR